MSTPELYYRYQELCMVDSRLSLLRMEFPVVRRTPAGVWIDIYGRARFILTAARKRYACPTKEEALISYRARKRRQVKILRAQLKQAEQALNLALNDTIPEYAPFSSDPH